MGVFFDINNQECGKVPILEVICIFEVRGAGQDRKARRYLPAPGCTGAGFLSWGWFWATWYRSRCFLVGILGQITTFYCFSWSGGAKSSFSVHL